jgi:hypothetical protein
LICCISALFALCMDAVVGLLPVVLALLAPVLLAVSPAAAPSPEAPPFHGRNIGPPTGRPFGPFHAVVSVGEPAEVVPLPPKSEVIDCRSCNNALPRPLVLTVPELPAAAELPVVVALVVLSVVVVPAASVLLLLEEARLLPRLEISDCRLANRLDIRLPGPVSPSGRAVGGTAGGPLGKPTPTDPVLGQAPLAPSPDTLPNDSNCDIRPLDSVGKAPPVIAPPDVPLAEELAEEPAENGVAVVAAEPLLGLD